MSQNCFKRFRPNPTGAPAPPQVNIQEPRFKRAHEDENHDGNGSKRRSHETDRGWVATQHNQPQQQPGYQFASRSQNNIEDLLQEW